MNDSVRSERPVADDEGFPC